MSKNYQILALKLRPKHFEEVVWQDHITQTLIKAFEKKIKRKFRISYKLTNPNETQTICANISLLKSLFKMDIEKNKINELIKDYL